MPLARELRGKVVERLLVLAGQLRLVEAEQHGGVCEPACSCPGSRRFRPGWSRGSKPGSRSGWPDRRSGRRPEPSGRQRRTCRFTCAMPCWARVSTSRMSRVFFAVSSSNSLTLLMIGRGLVADVVLGGATDGQRQVPATSTAIAVNRFIEWLPCQRTRPRRTISRLGLYLAEQAECQSAGHERRGELGIDFQRC